MTAKQQSKKPLVESRASYVRLNTIMFCYVFDDRCKPLFTSINAFHNHFYDENVILEDLLMGFPEASDRNQSWKM